MSKLFFDLLQPAKLAQFKADKDTVLAQYPMAPAMRKAVIDDDFPVIAAHVNPYLLRFYYTVRGVNDADFIARLNALPSRAAADHGANHG
ncbi:MAG: hypothetical protein ABIU95_14320 [Burkholderiales bacterium]